jgi:hypothetical protein
MRCVPDVFLLLLSVATIVFVPGCGGGTSQTLTTGTSTASTAYNVSLFAIPSPASAVGQVTVDTTGKVTFQLTGVTSNTSFSVEFCPAPAQNYSCFDVGTIASDTSGKANATMQFPKSGSWAGDFQLSVNGTAQYNTNIPLGTNTGVYMSTMQGQATANGNGTFLTGTAPPQGPLTSGTVTLTNGKIQMQLKGALPNTFYGAGQCPVNFGSDCYTLVDSNNARGFETDASGNVTFLVLLDGIPGDIFTADTQGASAAGYVGGFKVP